MNPQPEKPKTGEQTKILPGTVSSVYEMVSGFFLLEKKNHSRNPSEIRLWHCNIVWFQICCYYEKLSAVPADPAPLALFRV